MRQLMIKSVIFIISLSVAWWIIKSGVVNQFVDSLSTLKFVAEFIAGAFYTSVLTIPIALAMFISLAPNQNPIIFALIGGLGASVVDYLLIKLYRNNVSKDLLPLTKHFKIFLIRKTLKLLHLDFIIPVLGALIIASPLPDELGLFFLGSSNLSTRQIFILTYIFNTTGILVIVAPINLFI